MPTDGTITVSTRVKACNNCRAHKLRCDAREDYSKPCSRCYRLRLRCEVARIAGKPKRASKAEIEEELNRLKGMLESGKPHATRLDPIISPASNHSTHEAHSATGKDEIDLRQIQDCFDLFTQNYAPQTGIFNSALSPEQCLAQAPLLYWTVACIGSRKYAKNPTLLSLLAPRVATEAQAALLYPELGSIQAFMLLCMWPIPIDTMGKETSSLLNSLMLQSAVNKGLHIRGIGQDFSRQTLTPDIEIERVRARLWVACVITSLRLFSSYGLPPVALPEHHSSDMSAGLTAEMSYDLNIITTLTAANVELGQLGLVSGPVVPAKRIQSTIHIFASQLSRLEKICVGAYGRYHLLCAQLQVYSYHLFLSQTEVDHVDLLKLHGIACEVVGTSTDMDEEFGFASCAPDDCGKMLTLAASILLRLARSTMNDIFDLERGKTAYFSAILLFRKMSVQVGDALARSTVILTQLWTSNKIFSQPDGSYDSFTLLCRTRYAMSSVFDVWWRWRNEFANQPHPYAGTARTAEPSISQDSVATGVLQHPDPVIPNGVPMFGNDYDWDALFSGPAESWDLFNLDNEELMFRDTLTVV